MDRVTQDAIAEAREVLNDLATYLIVVSGQRDKGSRRSLEMIAGRVVEVAQIIENIEEKSGVVPRLRLVADNQNRAKKSA